MNEPRPRPLDLPAIPEAWAEPRIEALRALVAIVDRLRAPDGCAWDRAQTLTSLAPHLIEEAHEVVEAVETAGGERCDAIPEELGDLLMGIVLIARTAEDEGRFDLAAVARTVSDKLVRRHPHVFGADQAPDAEAALASWEAVKKVEREERGGDASALAGIPTALPALQRAQRTAQKSIAAGFRWSTARGALAKVREELDELEAELEASGALDAEFTGHTGLAGDASARVAAELGDLLIAGGFLGAYVGIDPERAARAALRRFDARFRHMESAFEGALEAQALDALMAAWERAKLAGGLFEPEPESTPEPEGTPEADASAREGTET